MQPSEIRGVLERFIASVARNSVSKVEVYRTQQVDETSAPTIGIVREIKGTNKNIIVVDFPDGTDGEFQVGNRWLTKGDTTVVFGGMAH